MGQSKGGYQKLDAVSPELKTLINEFLGQASGNTQAAAEGYKQFLPGGGGGDAYAKKATENFQQNTIPQILNSFGTGSKTSSALNQALAQGGANLNTDIMSKLAEYALQASQGLGNLGIQQSQVGSKDTFAYQPQQTPFWQQATLGLINNGGKVASAALGAG